MMEKLKTRKNSLLGGLPFCISPAFLYSHWTGFVFSLLVWIQLEPFKVSLSATVISCLCLLLLARCSCLTVLICSTESLSTVDQRYMLGVNDVLVTSVSLSIRGMR